MLTVPASLEFVRIIRLTASGVASRLGFDVEEIEDLRVAVDELASVVVERAPGNELEVVFSVHDDALRIEGRAAVETPGDPQIPELTSQILAAVVDKYELNLDAGTLRFSCTRALPTA